MKKQIINWYNLPARIHSLILTKQDKLTAGSNIKIEDNVISVTGGGGGSDLMVSITHADLLALVNSSSLTKGQQYRITDYVATVNTNIYNPNRVGFYARSNNHVFDIIVTADSESLLNENARVIRHEGDTYFPSHTKFEAWELKYTIFNDSERFEWAVENGKGVVYQMIDEWGNEAPYDFKSIQFQLNGVWVYTIGGEYDASTALQNCSNNIIKPSSRYDIGVFGLNNITMGSYNDSNVFFEGCRDIHLGEACRDNTFKSYCESNTLSFNCNRNIIGLMCRYNIFGDNCNDITMGLQCDNNILGSYKLNIHFDYKIQNININTQLSNFTTPPNGNLVEVIKTPTGVVMQQRINATTTESFDVV